MRFVAIALSLFWLSFAAAAKPIAVEIEDWYNYGNVTTAQDIRGAYSGRCYRMNNDIPVGALLITDSLDKPIDNGPGFPPTDPLKMYFELGHGDPKKMDDLSAAAVRATLVNFWESLSYTTVIFGSVGIRADGRDPYNYSVFSVRRGGPQNYLVAMEHVIVNNVVTSRRACYFFKKLY